MNKGGAEVVRCHIKIDMHDRDTNRDDLSAAFCGACCMRRCAEDGELQKEGGCQSPEAHLRATNRQLPWSWWLFLILRS